MKAATKPAARPAKPADKAKPSAKAAAKPGAQAATKAGTGTKQATSSKAAEEGATALKAKCAEAFEKADQDKDGVLVLRDVAAIIRAENDEWGFLDHNIMPTFIKAAFAAAKPDEAKQVRLAGFTEWYPAFLDHVANLKLDYAEAARIKVEAKAAAAGSAAQAAAGSAFSGTGVWECDLKQLLQALEAARAAKRTPLLIDGSGDGGDGFTPLETFFYYSGHQIWETKKTTVDVLIKKTASLEEALEEQRKRLLLAMARGYGYIIFMANSAPPLSSKYLIDETVLPPAILDTAQVEEAAGNLEWKTTWVGKVVREGGAEKLSDGSPFPLGGVGKDFQVVLVSRFGVGEYRKFLADVPHELMQPIHVTTQS